MGEVWKARDTRLGRDVALKVLPGDFLESEEGKARFEREARALAALNHPNIAVVYAFEEVPGSSGFPKRHLLAMELLEGETLRGALARGPLPLRRALDIAVQIAEGLAAAHGKGIVHRDVKPENVFLTRDGHTKLLDFGLARHDVTRHDPADTRGPTGPSSRSSPRTVLRSASSLKEN
jgi:serine/threonine protein kinase